MVALLDGMQLLEIYIVKMKKIIISFMIMILLVGIVSSQKGEIVLNDKEKLLQEYNKRFDFDKVDQYTTIGNFTVIGITIGTGNDKISARIITKTEVVEKILK